MLGAAHPWHMGLYGDADITALFAPPAMLDRFAAFEVALAQASAAVGLISASAAQAIVAGISTFTPDAGAMAAAMTQDGVAVPDYLRQLKAHLAAHSEDVHRGATSQDLVDTAHAQALCSANAQLADRLAAVQGALADVAGRWGAAPLQGRTRMQAALPITVADRMGAWAAPLPRLADQLASIGPALHVLQLGGAVGTRHALGPRADEIAERMATALGLHPAAHVWHTDRSAMAEYAAWCARLCGALGKIGQDAALMAQMGEIRLSGGGTSSAMPHKQNPIAAEALITLARFSAGLLGGMHDALMHEQERSGSAWPLEWLLLPQLVTATAASLRTGERLLTSITAMGQDI